MIGCSASINRLAKHGNFCKSDFREGLSRFRIILTVYHRIQSVVYFYVTHSADTTRYLHTSILLYFSFQATLFFYVVIYDRASVIYGTRVNIEDP